MRDFVESKRVLKYSLVPVTMPERFYGSLPTS
jgi:hypothetical protein